MSAWNEHRIATALCRQTFNRKCLLLLDNCNWTGCECDVLGVTQSLQIIDVEIKISRADFRADAAKGKWWHHFWQTGMTVHRPWPPKVWKHYYCMPKDIWSDELVSCLGSPNCGVLTIWTDRHGRYRIECERRSTPQKDSYKLNAAEVLDIARLAGLRMLNAYEQRDRALEDARAMRAAA